MKCHFQRKDLTYNHPEFQEGEGEVMEEIQVVYGRICHTIDQQDDSADLQVRLPDEK